MSSSPRVVVIGAGSSGLTATKALVQAGVDVVAYEASDTVGGNWVFRNVNGMSASYRTLHINTSRGRMQFSDFPMPADLPDYPHHTHIARYFRDYAEHFGVLPRVRFRRLLERAEPAAAGGWELRVRDLETGGEERAEADVLVVANGHHWDPRWPDPAYPGQEGFTGEQMHAHSFEDNERFRGKRVLVVGMGNSAMDIAVESSWVADRTLLSARRGSWVVPKHLMGKPVDTNPLATAPWLPWQVRTKLSEVVLRRAVGRMSDFGLPEPAQGLGRAHVTISDAILSRVSHGEVVPRPGIERFDGGEVVFTDGTRELVDVVVWATGYRVTFPFLDPGLVSAPENRLPLFRRVFLPERRDLAFVGLAQAIGAIMPVAEAQGNWIAEWVCGRYALPSREAMLADIERDERALRRRYVDSPRHTMQVDPDTYLARLRRELRAGRRRAQRAPATALVGSAPVSG